MVGFGRVIRKLDGRVVTQKKKFTANIAEFKQQKKAQQIRRVQLRKKRTMFSINQKKIGKRINGVKR